MGEALPEGAADPLGLSFFAPCPAPAAVPVLLSACCASAVEKPGRTKKVRINTGQKNRCIERMALLSGVLMCSPSRKMNPATGDSSDDEAGWASCLAPWARWESELPRLGARGYTALGPCQVFSRLEMQRGSGESMIAVPECSLVWRVRCDTACAGPHSSLGPSIS